MATLNRTFSVKNGIDVANTIIVDSNRNISNVINVAASYVSSNSAVVNGNVNVTGTLFTANILPHSTATSNIGSPTARFKSIFLSGATIDLDGVAIGSSGGEITANTFNAAVSFVSGGLNVLDQANTARNQANTAYSQANAGYAQANAGYSQANTVSGVANSAYDQANSAYGQANSARSAANSAANTVRVSANSGSTLSSKQLNFINTESIQVVVGDSLDGNANISFITTGAAVADAYAQANAAYVQANAARSQANAAYGEANLKLNLTGGTVSGDLTVAGNLFLTGNATYVNVATLKVNDSIIQLSTNSTSDALDIGFMGHYSPDGGTTNLHAGFIRHAADDIFYLIDGYGTEPSNNIIDVASANLAWLRANVNAAALLLQGNAVATQANLTIAHNQANAAYGQANAAYERANTKVSKSGDTMTGALTITTNGTGLSVGNAAVSFKLTVGALNVTTNTVTTSTSGQVVLDKFPATDLASVKYFVQANSSTDYHTTEVVLVQDATNVWITEYGSIQTGPSLGTFSADISSGDVRLLFTAVNNVNTIRSVRYGISP